MKQIITPNPDIPCTAGWCLQYVRQAFGLPARYASATEAWENSTTQHTGRDVPAGYWTPVWYAVDGIEEGHVALAAPDGSVYSTTDAGSTVPHHHPSLEDLEAHYAQYGPVLTWRGWTEDVAGYPVLDNTEQETAMPDISAQVQLLIDRQLENHLVLARTIDSNHLIVQQHLDTIGAQIAATNAAVAAISTNPAITPEALDAALKTAVGNFTLTLTPAGSAAP